MDDNVIDVADPAAWLRRGRSEDDANALAKAWRDYPDLPISAPGEQRMARTRDRAIAMRPIFEAMRERTEADRQAKNFAFITAKAENGDASEQDKAILRARDDHGYDWNRAVRYAEGWYAAVAGWNHRYDRPARSETETLLRSAYDRGFADGGGDTSDLFDTARRANNAADALAPANSLSVPSRSGKLSPSHWPAPQDSNLPVSWHRRAVIMTDADLVPPTGRNGQPSRRPSAISLVRDRSEGAATIIVLSSKDGFVAGNSIDPALSPITTAQANALIADPDQRERLRSLLAGEFDDLLITAQDEYLRVLDALTTALPVLRTMERTRNTPLQQRAHLETWLARGRGCGQNMGAGHIRWGKAAKGLTARLGEFTARYVGPAPERGHLIRICLEDGSAADGFVTADHAPLTPEIRISSKSRLRHEMAQALRTFGGATRLSARLPF
ncbi:hypothetical protein [Novosphingobium sp. HII-3]|uniref:hypothetical protein n=1 Tax=Novosphingobium sp. HII-3 TaxID=2075565 RepID=UPI000CDB2AA5|nr:hypothetical protein [Novosphingobium sp. HII-3]